MHLSTLYKIQIVGGLVGRIETGRGGTLGGGEQKGEVRGNGGKVVEMNEGESLKRRRNSEVKRRGGRWRMDGREERFRTEGRDGCWEERGT